MRIPNTPSVSWLGVDLRRCSTCALILLWATVLPVVSQLFAAEGAALPSFDFTTAEGVRGWQAAHDIQRLEPTAEGLVIHISGSDPYFHGPARNYPAGRLLWLNMRLKSSQAGTAQVFYFTDAPSEAKSVRFTVPQGAWHKAVVPMPALGSNIRLRIDPPGTGGTCAISGVWFEERVVFASPAWPQPEVPDLAGDVVRVRSGELELIHSATAVGEFVVEVAGKRMGIGQSNGLIGYVLDNEVRWTPMRPAAKDLSIRQVENGLRVESAWSDPDGGSWTLTQAFSPAADGAISLVSSLAVDRDREVIYLPLFTLFPGVGTFGTNKNQGLLPGIEYLENEPSSSEADLRGPAAWRLAPDSVKLTFPLLALQADGRYLGFMWQPQANVCAIHDSPDRQFQSGGHLMGLLFPGSDGVNREERSLLPYRPERLAANQPLQLRATLIGRRAESIIPAVQQYVQLAGLPPVPQTGYTASEYFELASRGWLESKIRESDLYRHAYWPGFNAQPAADAALWMQWLAAQLDSPTLEASLVEASEAALARVARQNYSGSQIGHVRYPLPPLIYGAVIENVLQAQARGEGLRTRFEPDGSVLYKPTPGKVDYGRTHWSREANGLTAQVVESLLEAAAFSGDLSLQEFGLRCLRAMDKFRNTVPRGAQTWEIPLHTPDILASAHLVRACTLGYELSGDRAFLEQAEYWAWTGVPFVYLTPPSAGPVGLYSTIPVLGATGWVAPVWIGQPVQWCGLVYADALYQLVRHDPSGPWQRIADGITAAGVQHTWPLTDRDRKGLIPDFYHLRAQQSDGPAINPATLLANALRLYGRPAAYDFRAFHRHGLLVHAPGELRNVAEHKDRVSFEVATWSSRPSRVLINGFRATPGVRINGKSVDLNYPHQFQRAEGQLVLLLEGPSTVEIAYRAIAAIDVRRSDPAGEIDISWSPAAEGFVLECASGLEPSVPWRVSEDAVRLESSVLVTTRQMSAGQEFFRLRARSVR